MNNLKSESVNASQSVTASKKFRFKGASKSGSSQFSGSHSRSGLSSVLEDNNEALAMSTISGGSNSTTLSAKNRLFDEKFKFIKNTTKEIPSLRNFRMVLNISSAVLFCVFIAGILLVNLIPSPYPYFEFLDDLSQLNVKTNELTFISRYLLLKENDTLNVGPCTFNPKKNESRPLCPWIEASEAHPELTVKPLIVYFDEVMEGLIEVFNSFESHYSKIRREGDDLDNALLGKFKVNQFVNGSKDISTGFEITTLWNVISLFALSGEVLHKDLSVVDAKREWNFILANRNVLNTFFLELSGIIPSITAKILGNIASAHLVLLIVSVVLAIVSHFGIIM